MTNGLRILVMKNSGPIIIWALMFVNNGMLRKTYSIRSSCTIFQIS